MPSSTSIKTVLATLHVRRSAQAVPLAAGCLKAALPPHAQSSCSLVDLYMDQSLDSMRDHILADNPALVAFPIYLWNRSTVRQLVRRLQRQAPELLIFAGGPEATADAEALLTELSIKGVLRGEGEETFVELIERLNQGQSLNGMAGLTLVEADEIVSGPDRPAIRDLNQLPSPWLTGALEPERGDGVLWETARGCPFNCAFCYDARATEGVRCIAEERLAKELRLFIQTGVDQVWVLDSTFNYPAERGKKLLRLMAKEGPQLHYHLEAKADYLDQETAELLAQISCSVQIGLQSAHPDVLAKINRSLNPDSFHQRIAWLAEAGITYGFDLIYGLPGDTHQGFCDSLDWALEMRPNQLDIFPLAVLPGTPLWDSAERLGVKAHRQPPYLIEADDRTVHLATATDLFYTRGRAVGFFDALCQICREKPSTLLQKFWAWAIEQKPVEELIAVEGWGPKEVLPLQLGYIADRIGSKAQMTLLCDLVRFHYYYAESVLASEVELAPKAPIEWQIRYQLNPSVQLEAFRFDPEQLLFAEQASPAQWPHQEAPCTILFLRQGGEVLHEALDEDFTRFLHRCDGQHTASEALDGECNGETKEWLRFAVTQGLIHPLSHH